MEIAADDQVADHDPAEILDLDARAPPCADHSSAPTVAADDDGVCCVGRRSRAREHEVAGELDAPLEEDAVAGAERVAVDAIDAAPGGRRRAGAGVVTGGADVVVRGPSRCGGRGRQGERRERAADRGQDRGLRCSPTESSGRREPVGPRRPASGAGMDQ